MLGMVQSLYIRSTAVVQSYCASPALQVKIRPYALPPCYVCTGT